MVQCCIWSSLIILFNLFIVIRGQPVTDPIEVGALQAIRRSLNDPMNNLRSWTTGDPCMSNWTGVLCFNMAAKDGYLHVRELQLLHKNLSGTLASELGQLSHMEILDFMWNAISGVIPKEIGKILPLRLLLLNGNELSGSLPSEIGSLSNLDRIQIDQNRISGLLPLSFANLSKAEHFHMNNNSISGQIPPELSLLPNLQHLLLDNNNLSGHLPDEFSAMPNLRILQLDNNHFHGASIPPSYGKMKKLLKLSLRNCGLQGPIPDFSFIPELGYLDLSWNQLSGSIPTNKLHINITTIDFSNNRLNGSIPSSFSGLPLLQILSLENNLLSGNIPDDIWQNIILGANRSLILNFKNNSLTNISHHLRVPVNATLILQGNPICSNSSRPDLSQYCGSHVQGQSPGSSRNGTDKCFPQSCPYASFFEYNYAHPNICFCAAPIRIGYRLKSPGFSDFHPYIDAFKEILTSGLQLKLYQLDIDTYSWEEGPRLRMYLKLFPDISSQFNSSEIFQINSIFTGWKIPDNHIFGPYELLNFTLLGPYNNAFQEEPLSRQSKGKVAGIIVGTVIGIAILAVIISLLIMRSKYRYRRIPKNQKLSDTQMKITEVKKFTFEELSLATDKFSNSAFVGQGGYGKVYRGTLVDGTAVAIKRAEGSLQGSKEFFTEIELLSRLHHRNLVSLIGYCDEDSGQMLVYEFVPNGSLQSHLSENSREALNFSVRLRVALGAARGILYLHTEADPPIVHRDIKSSNILLDFKFTAKVADFGISRLAPVPDIEGSEHDYVSTTVKGTPGYLDPEYFLTNMLTNKSDVYSLGVVFLELLTGWKPISYGKNIVREVNIAYQSGSMASVIDNRMGSYPSECVGRFMLLALKCCEEESNARPLMAEVVRELEKIYEMLPEASRVPFISAETNTDNDASTLLSSMPDKVSFVSPEITDSNPGDDMPDVAAR